MVYTVTFNPALDYVVRLPRLVPGALNRLTETQLQYGGKGVNVSVMLRRLGVPTTALGFAAGFTGRELQRGLDALGVQSDFVWLAEGETRINVKIHDSVETELNAAGPKIGAADLRCLEQKLDALPEGAALVLAGSIPASLPQDTYQSLLRRLQGKQLLTVVDAAGPLLAGALECRPFLIKPNRQELSELAGRQLATDAEVEQAARQLQRAGARNVLVSLGAQGALLLPEDGPALRQAAPQGTARNSVGAGDSMVAGFLAGWLQSGQPAQALRWGCAAGSATAFADALAEKEQVLAVLERQ